MYFRVKLPVCHSITSFLWFSFSFQHLSKALSVSKLLILKLTMSVKWVLCVAHQQAGNSSQRKKSFFKRTLPFGSALQTVLKEFKFQALLLSALILAQILTLQQSYNLRVAHPHEKVLKADNILYFFPWPFLSNSISAPDLGFGYILNLSLILKLEPWLGVGQ